MKFKDLTGLKFSNLTVIRRENNKKKCTMWYCTCDCGSDFVTYSTHLIRGNVTNCGCKRPRREYKCNWTGYGEISGSDWRSIRRGGGGIKQTRKSREHLLFDITIEYIWDLFLKQNRKCALTGIKLWFKTTSVGKSSASLDRIDNSKGYIVGNVQWVHKDINRMKNIYDETYFIEMCKCVAKTKGV